MRLADFEAMVRRLSDEVPPSTTSRASPRSSCRRATVPHPDRAEIYTMGECIPLPVEVRQRSRGVQSRVVLYYGSFAALAGMQADFDWREEAWETLTHELRHHLEWRARAPDLEEL